MHDALITFAQYVAAVLIAGGVGFLFWRASA